MIMPLLYMKIIHKKSRNLKNSTANEEMKTQNNKPEFHLYLKLS